MKIRMNWIEWLVALACIAGLVAMFVPAFHAWNAKRVNDIRESYITQDANVRVNSYEWFYDMYHQIQATERKAELAKGTPEERGIRMVLSGMIQEYNAKCRMTGTRAQWKPRDLPFEITER